MSVKVHNSIPSDLVHPDLVHPIAIAKPLQTLGDRLLLLGSQNKALTGLRRT